MPCLKTLTMSVASSGDTPLHDAAYVPAPINKIFGTSGPYVIKFNATTGAREGFVRLSAPMYGDCRICYHAGTGMLFAAGHNEVNNRWFSMPHPSRNIWQVNPSTLAVTPLNVGSWLTNFEFQTGDVFGPQWIKAYGNSVFFQHESRNLGFYWARVNATNFADHNMGSVSPVVPMNSEQFEVADGLVYHIEPRNGNIIACNLDGSFNDSMNVYPNPITGVVQCDLDSQLYLVCGNSTLIRVDNFSLGTYTTFDLSGIVAGANPVRIKNGPVNKLFIPCMTSNAMIVWDPVTENGTPILGLENPVDVVFSDTTDPSIKRVFYVQNSPTGLRPA